MKLGEEILKRINNKFEASTMVDLKFERYDIALKTDEEGNAVQAFVGKRNSEGIIKGDRYTRTIKFDKDGKKIKDHWDRKGFAT